MKKLKLFLILFFVIVVSLILETTIFNFPYIFLIGIITIFFHRKMSSFIFAFIIGFFIDSLRLTSFGITPIFIFSTFLLILLFEKYSGSKDLISNGIIIYATAFLYAYVLNYSLFLMVLFSVLSLTFLLTLNFFQDKKTIRLRI